MLEIAINKLIGASLMEINMWSISSTVREIAGSWTDRQLYIVDRHESHHRIHYLG